MKSRSIGTRFSSFFKKDPHIVLLFLLCLIIIISHTFYSIVTFQQPKWDEHIFLGQAISTYDQIRSGHPSFEALSKIYEAKPPLYALSLTVPLLLFGTFATYKMALWINVIFYIGTIIGIYFLGKEFFSKTASLMASIIFACYGFPLFYLHFVYSETATTMFVVLTLLFIKKSDYLKKRKSTFFAGLFFALGCTTRWVTPLFTIGGIITIFVTSFYGMWKEKKYQARLLNLCLFLFVSLVAPLAIYYFPNLAYFSSYAFNSQAQAPEWVEQLSYLPKGLSNPFGTRSIMFYFNIISQQTIYFFILFVVGLTFCIIKFKKYMFFTLSLLIPYVFFTFGSILKDDRYIVPIYPMMALSSAVVFNHLKYKYVKIFLIILTVTIASLNFLGASWGLGPLGKQGLKDIVLPEFIHHPRRIYLTTMVWPPRKDLTKAETIVKIVEEKSDIKNPYVLNTYTVNPLELDVALTSIEQFEKRSVFRAGNLRVINKDDYNDFLGRMLQADFIIVKDPKTRIANDSYTGYETDNMIFLFNKALENNTHLPKAFTKVAEVYYPLDKIKLHMYKKTIPVSKTDWDPIINWMKKYKQ